MTFNGVLLCVAWLLINASGCDGKVESEKYKSTREAMMSSLTAIQLYRLDYGIYPDKENWQYQVKATVDKNAQRVRYQDQWGKDLQFEISDTGSGCEVTVYSTKKSDSGKIFLLYSKPCLDEAGERK